MGLRQLHALVQLVQDAGSDIIGMCQAAVLLALEIELNVACKLLTDAGNPPLRLAPKARNDFFLSLHCLGHAGRLVPPIPFSQLIEEGDPPLFAAVQFVHRGQVAAVVDHLELRHAQRNQVTVHLNVQYIAVIVAPRVLYLRLSVLAPQPIGRGSVGNLLDEHSSHPTAGAIIHTAVEQRRHQFHFRHLYPSLKFGLKVSLYAAVSFQSLYRTISVCFPCLRVMFGRMRAPSSHHP